MSRVLNKYKYKYFVNTCTNTFTNAEDVVKCCFRKPELYQKRGMPRFCVKCGSQIADGAKFCPVCGNVIEMEPKSAAPEVPEAPQPAAEPTPGPVQPVYQEPVQQPVQPPVQPVPQPEPEPKPVYRAEDDEDFSPKQVRILVRTMAVIC